MLQYRGSGAQAMRLPRSVQVRCRAFGLPIWGDARWRGTKFSFGRALAEYVHRPLDRRFLWRYALHQINVASISSVVKNLLKIIRNEVACRLGGHSIGRWICLSRGGESIRR
jgi:hypothetical protein